MRTTPLWTSMTALGVLLLRPRGAFVVLLRGRSRDMDYHTHLDDRFELQPALKMSHGGGGGV
jgi:hypothetical protein